MVTGILAHVDAGKTTLSEALLFTTGEIRSLGRVDHKDAFLDNDVQERERGITIFSKQARLEYQGMELTLLDTPGHVDFSAEMERTLACLDYAILVISGPSGVQGHTRTLWKLLKTYGVPVFLFVNKMDLQGTDRQAIQEELKAELSEGCVDVTGLFYPEERNHPIVERSDLPADREIFKEEERDPEEVRAEILENIAVLDEEMLDSYMENGTLENGQLQQAVKKRLLFPCFYGCALHLRGVQTLLEGLFAWTAEPEYGKEFSARVYKIGRDSRGVRLTHMKITGGSLRVREKLEYKPKLLAGGASGESVDSAADEGLLTEKADQIRKYSGEKYETVDVAKAGEIVAVAGLSRTYPGQGLGTDQEAVATVLEPVLNYQLLLPKGVSPMAFLASMRILEEEDPKLRVVWKEEFHEIHVQLMGKIQMEVLRRLIWERFGVPVDFGPGSIVYKETIAKPVEGVGHFEPLRHYAEVHLLMAPGEPGSGITVDSICSEDVLDRNWQRLIATHVEERIHKGVLTGAALTDVHMTIVTGRAHIKHTEGGDFRQATYRAIRQGLKSTASILLEPYYDLTLEIPMEFTGRALTDLEKRFAKVEAPAFSTKGTREMAVIKGRAPASTMQDYINEVHAYTQGLGSLLLEVSGYDICHNPEEVIAAKHYDSELDFRNPTGSVFCAQGSGYVVPWDEVPSMMHMDYVFPPDELEALWEQRESGHSDTAWLTTGLAGGMNYSKAGKGFSSEEAENLSGAAQRQGSWSKSVSRMSQTELDAELADVYAREFGMSRQDMEDQERRKWAKKETKKNGIPEGLSGKPRKVKYDQHGNPIYPKQDTRRDFLIVDGYNIIFSWEELKELSKSNIDSARDKLVDILCNYQGFKQCRMAVVFDAYKVKDNSGKALFYDGISRKMTTLKSAREKAEAASAAGKKAPQGIEIFYTKTDEIADARIERMVHENQEKFRIAVATNDGLEQLTVLSLGAIRMTAKELQQEIEREAKKNMEEFRAANRNGRL